MQSSIKFSKNVNEGIPKSLRGKEMKSVLKKKKKKVQWHT